MSTETDIIQASDEALMQRVQQGDYAAFSELYRRYNYRILAFCLRLIRERSAAEDAFQVVFTNMFEKRGQFNGDSFAAWIFTIARNTCFKNLRRANLIVDRHLDIEELELLGIHDTHDEAAETDWPERLLAAIEKLSPEFREPLQLYYYDKLSYEQIASILGITLSLVKVRIFRAKKTIKEMLHTSHKEKDETKSFT